MDEYSLNWVDVAACMVLFTGVFSSGMLAMKMIDRWRG